MDAGSGSGMTKAGNRHSGTSPVIPGKRSATRNPFSPAAFGHSTWIPGQARGDGFPCFYFPLHPCL